MRKKSAHPQIIKEHKKPPEPRPSFWVRIRRAIWRQRVVMLPVAVFILLVAAGFAGYATLTKTHVEAARSRVVIISHDGTQQTVPSDAKTVGALIRKLHIPLHKGDVVEPSTNTAIDQDAFHINIYRGKPVEIVDGGHKTFSFSAAATPRSIAIQAGAKLYPEDDLVLKPTKNFLKDTAIGERVVIDRATPIKLNLYGKDITLRTQAKTVGNLIKDRGIHMQQGDILKPEASTPIKKGLHVFVLRKGANLVTKTEKIDMPVKVVHDKHLSYGTKAIRQKGSPGKKVITYVLTKKDGKIVKKTAIQSVVTERPVTQIVAKGTATPPPGDVKGDITYWANHYGDSPSYLLSIARCESNFNPRARNPSGATGLFQFKPATFRTAASGAGIPNASIYDANSQARAAAWYISQYGGGAWACG
jgi:uncharacterized protein YabE (DUF348 family)